MKAFHGPIYLQETAFYYAVFKTPLQFLTWIIGNENLQIRETPIGKDNSFKHFYKWVLHNVDKFV